MEQRDGNCHKMSQVVPQIVVTFFSRPLPAVPFWFSPILGPRNPLFQEMGIRGPVWGRGNRNVRDFPVDLQGPPSRTYPSSTDPAEPLRPPDPDLISTRCRPLRLLNALNSEDRGLKVRFSLATIVFETFELILCQMLSSQGKKRTFKPLSSLFSAFSNLEDLIRT